MRLELLGQQNYSIAWSVQEHWADKFHYLTMVHESDVSAYF